MSFLFEIYLKSLKVAENGFYDKKTPLNLLSANLIYPKEGIPSVESVKQLKLKDGQQNNFNSLTFPERILFKNSIQGNSFIQFELTAKDLPSKMVEILKKALGAGLLAGIGAITGGIGNSLVTGSAKSFVESVFEEAKGKAKIKSIGQGYLELTNATPEGELKIE